ncbi:transcriptional regulator [Paenibacillus sp. PL91]|uniref:transcriptional regulator n=1 Tax=Paenibacillus sp. PL91 TaxID=2729538 RepID=UPI00145C645A|nr:transcriptional regulator [Paenibacillus sp. PL91]MBC9203688.1 transcriptional regulator [Paenibacillus sp. PL91]
MLGIRKKRTPLGEWLDKKGILQEWIVKEAKLNKFTISKLANKTDLMPSGRTMKKILQAVRKIDPNIKQDDFWRM